MSCVVLPQVLDITIYWQCYCCCKFVDLSLFNVLIILFYLSLALTHVLHSILTLFLFLLSSKPKTRANMPVLVYCLFFVYKVSPLYILQFQGNMGLRISWFNEIFLDTTPLLQVKYKPIRTSQKIHKWERNIKSVENN